jgi:hypothetical protein
VDKSHTPTPRSSFGSSGPLALPADAPDWVRHRLERLAAEGMLLSEEQLQQMLFSPDEERPPVGTALEALLTSLPGNPQAVRPDIEPEIEESIPLLDPAPKPRLRLDT